MSAARSTMGLRPAEPGSAPSPAASASTAARVFASFLVARAVFGLAYLGAAAGKMRIPWYHPLEHAWELASQPRPQAMGWFGLTALALVAAAVAGALAYLVSGRGAAARALSKAAIILAIARAGGLVLLVDFAYFGWTLTHQKAAPWPEPVCPPDAVREQP